MPQRRLGNFPEREIAVGTRGPVPKRSDQRHGHRKSEVESAPSGPPPPIEPVALVVPPPADDWHEMARDWYLSLQQSGQSAFYQASDWMEAKIAAEVLSRMLDAGRLSAQLFAAWSSHTVRLLVTEGDRRRVRIELERGSQEDPDAKAGVAAMDEWRKRLAGTATG